MAKTKEFTNENEYHQVATPKVVVDVDKDNLTKNETTAQAKIVPLSKLFSYADRVDKWLMVFGTLGAALTGASQPIQILFFGDVMNAFNGGSELSKGELSSNINKVVLNFVYVGIVVLISGMAQVACWTITASRQAKRLRHTYATAILRQEVGWFDVNEPMTLSTKVADTSLIIQEGMGRKIGDGINFTVMSITGLIIGFVKGWELALVLFAFTPLIAISGYFMMKSLSAAIQSGVESYAEAGGIAEEAISNIRTVHMFNSVPHIVAKYTNSLKKTEAAGVKKGLSVGIGTGVMFFIIFCTYGFGMYYGAVKVTNDYFSVPRCTGDSCYDGGRVIIVFFSIVMAAMALGQAGPSAQAIFAARSAAYDVFELINRTSKIDVTSEEGMTLKEVQGHIKLENVRFRYPSRPEIEVCSGYSLDIPAGQKIALVGPSGSGKSTIVSLLERFYDPDSGVVKVDNHDVKEMNIRWLRNQIGLVGQEPALFSDTIAANIRLGKKNATIEEIHEAAKQANAYDFIMSFPQGFDTEVGGRGAQLSGGQKQRIAIARAIIKNPAILLLDEATSALDAESERVVQESLDILLATRKRTTIIIAHRLSTIRDADRIAVLREGNVVELGTHDELMAIENGHYNLLVKANQKRTEVSDEENNDENAEDEFNLEKNNMKRLKSDASAQTLGKVEETASSSDENKSATEEERQYEVPMSRLWKLSRPEMVNIFFGSLGAIVNGATFPLWGVLLTKCTVVFFNYSLGYDEIRRQSIKWMCAFFGLGIAFCLAIVLQNHQFAIAAERLTSRVRVMCFNAMLRQDIGWFDFDAHSPGALTTRLATDSATVRNITAEVLNVLMVNLSTLGIAFAIAFYYSWEMTLALLAVFPLLGFSGYINAQQMSGVADKTKNDGDVKAGSLLSESINSIRTVASFCMEKYTNEVYYSYLQQSSTTDRKIGVFAGIGFSISQGIMFFALAFLFWFGGWLVTRGSIDFEEMLLVLNPVLFSSFGVGMAAQSMGDFGKSKKAASRIFSVIDRRSAIDCTSDAGDVLEKVNGEIELKHVDFNYPSRPDSQIYKNYNLKIRSGQTVALVGSSGSGKSTAINLVQRFYDPLEGAILLDGHDIKTLNVKWLREHISIVSQEPVLFAGTIGENIATGKPGASQAEIEQAAKQANAHDFIMQFPDRYNTEVGDQGVQVSGGQKQRIAIARAIIRDPEVLLLDEATSALDNESERVVQESLDKLLQQKKRTTIIVAHRLSTIRNADVIAVVNDGCIVEKGTHDELLAIPDGVYRGLVARQRNSH